MDIISKNSLDDKVQHLCTCFYKLCEHSKLLAVINSDPVFRKCIFHNNAKSI